MPISFPTNPSSGDTYDYGGIHYIFNNDGWVNKSIYGISAGTNISFSNYNGTGPIVISATDTTGITSAVTSFNGYTGDVVGWAWYNDGAGSTLDAGLLHGISGQRFVENLQTGLLYGGLLQVNAGNSAYFDITSGVGVISSAGASLTAYPVPSFNYVTWGALSGLTVAGITSDEETWISINSAGNVVQQNTKWLDSQFDDSIPLGVLIHPNNTSINFAVAIPHVAYGQPSQLDPFVRAFGPIKISGHEISANGANLQVNKSTGSAYLIGRNYATNPSSPNVVEDTNATPISTIYRYYRDGSGKFTVVTNSSIDPSKYDDGTGTLNTVPGGQYTIQRLFFLPGVPTVLASYYGRELYNSIETAQANIPFEQFNEDDSTASLGVFAGYLIVKSGATQLNNTSDAKFINSGIFRNLSNIGGGGVAATSLDDLSDVTITSAANGQVLKYSSGVWVNDSVSNLNLVSAAVAGSGISVSGATGSVTITNTGVFSFNGKTGTIQGVSSINGSTGAITNVAFTNVDNLFSTSQTISGLLSTLTVEDTDYPADIQIIPGQGQIKWTDTGGGYVSSLVFSSSPSSPNNVVTLPSFTTTLAGLTGTQTFTGLKTFSSQANFSAGISASGATFNGNIILQNNEIIRNTTNGRIDLMPAPTGTTHFGIYFDTTGWGYGVQIGTIRSSDNALNQENILWNVPLVVADDTNFTFGSSSAYRMRQTTTGNYTLQIALAGGPYAPTNSNSLALIDVNGLGNANRSPGTTHANPNLYIYANGNASANDFMRLEHGRTAGLIQTGGTSGLTLAPGSGILGISGSFTASGATFAGNISVNTARLGRTGSNLVFGVNAGGSVTSGTLNTIIGDGSGALISSGGYNTSLGFETLRLLTTGADNTAVGMWALRNGTSGNNNTAVGSFALRSNTTGNDNTAIGFYALNLNQTGTKNTAIGNFALSNGATAAANNVAIGYAALYDNTSGTQNTAVGYNSMVSNTSGSYNSGIGIASLYSLTTGQLNTAVGTESLYSITNTDNNTAVGQLALKYATQGSNNTAIGTLAGAYKTASNTNLTTIGNNNVYIGSEARASGDSINNEIVIGSKAVGLGANTAVIGATAQASATIYGLFNAPGGISASGATFSGNISAPNIVNNFGGATGGITFGGYMLTWGGLTSSYDILPLGYNSMSAPIATLPTVNNAYFCPIFINRNLKIKTIGHQTGSSGAGNTGQMMFGLYSSDNYGYPDVKLYNSSGITLSTGAFATQRATVDYDVSPGLYWLAIIWSAIGSSTNGYGRLGGRITTLTNINTTSVIGQTTTHNLRRNMGGFTFTNVSGATFTEVTGTDSVCIFYTSEYRA